jgi:cupin 2 domain-containing protein
VSKINNLLKDLPDASVAEQFEPLLRRPGLLIERIVSLGQATPDKEWYDQPWDEWILLLSGTAELLIETESAPVRLVAGDSLLLPTHCRHRVVRTSAEEPAVWLAVHYGDLPDSIT